MTGRYAECALNAVGQLAAAGGDAGRVALAIVAAQIRARDESARQFEARDRDDWIPRSDWCWIAGLSTRHLDADPGCEPCSHLDPDDRTVGAYWAAYDEMRAQVRAGARPVALSAARRLRLLDQHRGESL